MELHTFSERLCAGGIVIGGVGSRWLSIDRLDSMD